MSDAASSAPDEGDDLAWADAGLDSRQDRDVRRIVAELVGRGEPALEDVDWGQFQHAYGDAGDVPDLLRGLSDADPQRASQSLTTLWNLVVHQGTSSAPAALAVPFLIRAAADPAVHDRALVLMLAAEAGHREHFGRDRREDLLQVAYPADELWVDESLDPIDWTLQAARQALTAGAPTLIELLGDDDPLVRAHTAYALATAASPPPTVRRALRERLGAEDDPSVRISLVLAIAQLAVEHADDPGVPAWTETMWRDERQPDDMRLAGVLAWLCTSEAPPPEPLLELLSALVGPPAQQWMRHVPWPDRIEGHGGLAAWLVAFLGDAPDAQARLTTTLVAHPNPAVAESACRAAHDLARTWRTQAEETLNLIAGCLDHGDPTVRETAARLLTRSGSLPAHLVDRVAADLHDPDRRAWAAAVLAHAGDARAVTPLVELLTRSECPWPTKRTWDSGPPQRLLDLLEPHADAIWPAVVHRLAAPDSDGWDFVRRDLLRGLATWEQPPSGLVTILTELLGRPGQDHDTIATMLGGIGPAASAAVPALDQLATHTDPNQTGALVWARWRITGERTAATADTLARLAATPPHGPHSLPLLADLGPAAALHEPMIRNLLNDGYEWIRAEAANALWRCTGDTTNTVPVLIDLFNDDNYPRPFAPVHAAAVTYLGHIGPAADAATPALTRFLHADRRTRYDASRHDQISWDQHAQRLTTTALNQIHAGDFG